MRSATTRGWFVGAIAAFGAAFAVGCSGNMAGGDAATDAPIGDAQGTDATHNDAPAGDAPTMDAPASDVPTMDVPAADVPTNDVPVTDVPVSDVPMPTSHTAIVNYGVDLQRTIANRTESVLTVAAVMTAGRFGRDTAFVPPAFDGDIYTQPLYLPAISVGGVAHDVLFVTTQNNSVYAIDAASGAMLWRMNLGTPVQRTQQPCGNINPQTGILGGSVIDAAAGTFYTVAYTSAAGGLTFTINALDVTTGAQRPGYPQAITPPTSNGSTFTASTQQVRGAITLVGDRIYVPFGGLWGDCGTYHGWIVGIDTTTPSHQTAFATPGNRSGIWGPSGIASDGTHLFAATGNGSVTGAMGEYDIRFATGASGPTFAGTDATAYFTPSNRNSLDASDTDIGSNAPVVLPDHVGSGTPHLLFQGGKAGVGYLLNRDNLGGTGTGTGVTGEGVYSAQISSGGVYGATASWSDGTNIYVFVPVHGTRSAPCTGSGGVMTLRLGVTGTSSTFNVAWCPAAGEASPAVSSNGNSDGILWVAYAGGGNLRAYNIADGTMIYAATNAGAIRKWVPPVIADGRVFVTNNNTVTMFRLLH